MKTLHFTHAGKEYIVNESGHITSAGQEFSGEWIFKGVSFHHWRNGVDMTLADCFSSHAGMCGGIVWDVDHGTTRAWGGVYYGKLPRVTNAYVS